MKHKILISIERGIHNAEFLSDIKSLLNASHTKLLTGISITNYLEKKLLVVKGEGVSKEQLKIKIEDIEFEIAFERESKVRDMQFSMHRGAVDDALLQNLSSVADLMIIDRKVIQKYCGEDVLSHLVEAVSCPVLILPELKKVDSLVMLHDGSISSVKSVKHFLSLFNADLRKLPVSVLVSEPETKHAIEAEKVFIDYIKLFFEDIGIKLIDDDPIECLVKEVQNTSGHPMFIAGEIGGNEVLNCTPENRIITDSAPTFIFKNR